MQKYFTKIACVLLILLCIGGFLFFKYGLEPVDETPLINKSNLTSRKPHKEMAPQPLPDMDPAPESLTESKEKVILKKRPIEKPLEAKKEYSKYIEDIKEKVYERQIESLDQIPLLDEIVQTGDKDVRQFWGDGWSSVDDWKKEENGFTLEKKTDGSLVFNPDATTARKYTFFETPKAYTYDPEHKEFVNEVDYYGKTIYNVMKFINDDVLAMMTISGPKVSLNLYQKNAGQLAAPQAGRQLPGDLGTPGLTR